MAPVLVMSSVETELTKAFGLSGGSPAEHAWAVCRKQQQTVCAPTEGKDLRAQGGYHFEVHGIALRHVCQRAAATECAEVVTAKRYCKNTKGFITKRLHGQFTGGKSREVCVFRGCKLPKSWLSKDGSPLSPSQWCIEEAKGWPTTLPAPAAAASFLGKSS